MIFHCKNGRSESIDIPLHSDIALKLPWDGDKRSTDFNNPITRALPSSGFG